MNNNNNKKIQHSIKDRLIFAAYVLISVEVFLVIEWNGIWVERKRCRLYYRKLDHNSYDHQNIFCAEFSKLRAPESTSRCNGIIKPAGGICRGVLKNDYEVYKNESNHFHLAMKYPNDLIFFTHKNIYEINKCCVEANLDR